MTESTKTNSAGLEIWGASDDLVELRGGIDDEVDCWDRTVSFSVGDPLSGGVVVEMDYGAGGVWAATLRQFDEDVPIPWPVAISVAERGYSVLVRIECPPNTPVAWTKRDKTDRGAA